jgi:hypothetical protein
MKNSKWNSVALVGMVILLCGLIVDCGKPMPVPSIVLSKTSLTVNVEEGAANPPNEAFDISNGGGGTLDWSASEYADWLTISPDTGASSSGMDTITAAVDVAGKRAGNYHSTVTISAPGASNNPQTIEVSLNSRPMLQQHPITPEVDAVPSVVSNRDPVIDLERSQSNSSGWGVAGYGKNEMAATVACEAFDPDGDILSFQWEINAGSLTGHDREVTWLVPAKPGTYVIKVIVTDNKGGSNAMILTNTLGFVEITDGTCHTEGEWQWQIEK